MKKYFANSVIALSASFFVACGGGGGSSGSSTASSSSSGVNSGVLLDAAVEGIDYKTATLSGVTDSLGTFKYKTGEQVTFSVGGITLGKANGSSVLTPKEMLGTSSLRDDKMIKMLRFMQSIDEDNNPSNGIKISQTLKTSANSASSDISADGVDVDGLLTSIGIASGKIVNENSAVSHFKTTLNEINKTNTGNYAIVKGVYESSNTILDINDIGMINVYKYDTVNECVNTVAKGDKAYSLDGQILTADKENKKFFIKVGTTELGYTYDTSDKLSKVYYGGMIAGTGIDLTVSGNSIFMTKVPSTKFASSSDIAKNLCSAVPASEFKNVMGVYQISTVSDTTTTDAAIKTKIKNNLLSINRNGVLSSYTYNTTKSCFAKAVSPEYNYEFNQKLSIKDFGFTVNVNNKLISDYKAYYGSLSNGDEFGWLSNGVDSSIYYKTVNNNPNISQSTIHVGNINHILYLEKSNSVTLDTLESKICK